MHKVIVDTNFLIDMARFSVDPDSISELLPGRCDLIMPKAVKEELQRIKGKHAKTAIRLGELLGVKTVENPVGVKSADEIIIAVAGRLGAAVATNDARLRKRLRALGVKTIYLRARKHLEIS